MIGEVVGFCFYAGEEKYVEAKAAAAKRNQTVVIDSAMYELSKKAGGDVVETGECEIRGDKVRFLLRTAEVGTYSLKITVSAGEETIIQRVPVSVKR